VALGGTEVQANAGVHKAMSYAHARGGEEACRRSIGLVCPGRGDGRRGRSRTWRRAARREMPDWVANKAARLERIRAAKVALEAEAKALPPDGD